MRFRTDLALESTQIYEDEKGRGEIPGVEIKKRKYGTDISVTEITVESKEASEILDKPCGVYITIEVGRGFSDNEDEKDRAAFVLAEELLNLSEGYNSKSILVAGLGNTAVTPDSLGPLTCSKIDITRPLVKMDKMEGLNSVSAISPGVLGTTGIESAPVIEAAADISEATLVIAVDSLAARDIRRIGSTIQINNTVIFPGAGIGNNRKEISYETIGRPVISVGVPTVIDSKTLILEALDDDAAENFFKNRNMDMIVTSSDIDTIVKDFSDCIAKGINIAAQRSIY